MATSFNCSQQDLYTGGRILWQMYLDRWADFADYSPIFTQAHGIEKLAGLNAAERLPDKAAREAVATAVLREMGAANKEFLINYQTFRSYIKRIYDDSVYDLKLAAIGEGYYAKASANTWGSVSALIAQVVPFIEDNETELMSKNVIPTTFLNKLKASAAVFSDKYNEYTAAVKSVAAATSEKANANNAVYEAISEVNKTAQIIYKKDPETAKLFVWATIVSQTHGIRSAGVSGRSIIEGTKTGVSGVTLRIKGTDKTAVTDADGRYEIVPLSMGDYQLEVEKDGYEKQTISFKVTAGVVSRVNVGLVLQAAA